MNLRDRDASPDTVKALLQPIFDRVAEKMRTAEPRIDPTAEEKRQALMAEIGVPTRYRGVTFATSQPLPSLVRARQFVRDDLPAGRCLVLSGPPSAGKTHSAVCALAAAASIPRRMLYFGDCAGTLLDGGPARRDLVDLLQHVHFLVLDDLGVEYHKSGGVIETALDRIFYKREADRLPTLVTTNLPPDDLKTTYSERVLDRWRGWGEVHIVASAGLRSDLPAWVTEP